MKPLESQLVCKELSIKMKDLGFKQESLFYFTRCYSERDKKLPEFKLSDVNHAFYAPACMEYKLETISAYTVAELGEMLPPVIRYKTLKGIEDSFTLKTFPEIQFSENRTKYDSKGFWCGYYKREELIAVEKFGLTEADSRAKMLIYLKENNLI